MSSTPVHEASRNKHHDRDVAQMLLDHGASANAQNVLGHGANVDARDKWDWTPLHVASRGGYLEVVQMLLDRGAHINAQGVGDLAPLHLAATRGHLNVAALLLKNTVETYMRVTTRIGPPSR